MKELVSLIEDEEAKNWKDERFCNKSLHPITVLRCLVFLATKIDELKWHSNSKTLTTAIESSNGRTGPERFRRQAISS